MNTSMPPTDPDEPEEPDVDADADSEGEDLDAAPVVHVPVLLEECLRVLAPRPGAFAVDVTLGAGGHSEQLLRALAPGGHLLALDVDPEALPRGEVRLRALAQELSVGLTLERANFNALPEVLRHKFPNRAPDAILADLGVSSPQLDQPERGFSFRVDAPLDMRMDPTLPETAADLLRNRTEEELADIIFFLGNEPKARRIARWIMGARERNLPLETTGQLEHMVRRALKVRGHRRVHPATKTFMALRMAVNKELEVLETFLESAPETLAPGGVLAVISFHSGEDRLVKHGFKAQAKSGRFQLVDKQVIRPSAEECARNPRARSAKMRALRRIP